MRCEIIYRKAMEVIELTERRTVVFHAFFSKSISGRRDRRNF